MNITTNQNTLRPNAPEFFTIVASSSGQDDTSIHVNKHGDIVAIDPEDSECGFPDMRKIQATITEILADIRAGFMWLDALERRTGKHIAECTGSLPCGRWVVIDIGGRCLHLLESPRDESVELPLAVECGV